jgi:hypothetical protein
MSARGQQCRSLAVRAVSAYDVIADELLEHVIRHQGQKTDIRLSCVGAESAGEERLDADEIDIPGAER